MKKIFIVLIIIALIAIIIASGCVDKSEIESGKYFEVKDYGNNFYLVYIDSVAHSSDSAMFILGESISKIIDENPGMTLSSITPFVYRTGNTYGYYLYFTNNTNAVSNNSVFFLFIPNTL